MHVSVLSCTQRPLLLRHTFSRVYPSTHAARPPRSANTRVFFQRAAQASWIPLQAQRARSSSWLLGPVWPKGRLLPPAALHSTTWALTAAVVPGPVLSLSIILALFLVPPTILTLAPPSRPCCLNTAGARSSCVPWTTATAPVCPLCPVTAPTHPTPARPRFPGRRSFPTLCPRLPPCRNHYRAFLCATGSTPHRATGTPTSTGCTASLLLNTMSLVNFPLIIFLEIYLKLFPFFFLSFFISPLCSFCCI